MDLDLVLGGDGVDGAKGWAWTPPAKSALASYRLYPKSTSASQYLFCSVYNAECLILRASWSHHQSVECDTASVNLKGMLLRLEPCRWSTSISYKNCLSVTVRSMLTSSIVGQGCYGANWTQSELVYVCVGHTLGHRTDCCFEWMSMHHLNSDHWADSKQASWLCYASRAANHHNMHAITAECWERFVCCRYAHHCL